MSPVTQSDSRRRLRAAVIAIAACLLLLLGTAAQSGTLEDVLRRQRLVCGVSQGIPGFSAKDASGRWQGFDVDFCRALAAAILGASDKVDYVPLSADERFDALKSSKIDVLSRNSTWTMSRDVGQPLQFVGVYYYDGQSFMARAERGWVSAMEISGAKVCVQSGTTSEINARAYFTQLALQNEIVTFANVGDLLAAYAAERCDVFTADRSALAAQRLGLDQPDAHVLLPEVISKEPLGPVVRKDDTEWADVVRWVLFALINAEEEGHSRATAGKKQSTPPLSSKLPNDWYERIVQQVGNYSEIFEKNLGKDTPLAIERGVNSLWTQGGLLYVPPMR